MSASPASEAGYTYLALRRYDQAERYLERHAPITGEYARLAHLRLARDGDPATLRAWVDTTLGPAGFPQLIAHAAHGLWDPTQLRALVRTLCVQCDAAIPLVPNRRERDWQRYFGIALLHELAGRLDQAQAYYDSGRVRLEGLDASRVEQGGSLDQVYAKLGRGAEAVRVAEQELELTREHRDVFAATFSIQRLAEVYLLVGEQDAALEQLEWLLSHPSFLSVPLLRVDPLWDPLRSNPRFQALLAKYQR